MERPATTTASDAALDVEARFHSIHLPTSKAAREALLQDSCRLREVCEDLVAALGLAEDRRMGDVIGIRAAGRVVAHVHRELGLPVPSDDALYSEIMSHTELGGAFALNRDEFVSFVQDVLSHCLQGVPLVKQRPQSAPLPKKHLGSSTGLINIHLQSITGNDLIVQVEDSDTTQAFASEVESEFGISACCQRFINGNDVLDPTRPLYEQAVTSGSVLSVVHSVPQATLLRIRRCDIGDRSIGTSRSRPVSGEARAKSKRRSKQEELPVAPKAAEAFVKHTLPLLAASPTPTPDTLLANQHRKSNAHKGGRIVFQEFRRTATVGGA